MISVVIPVYNGSRFIGQAIESILNQTFQKFELIVVDDGSTDGTLEILNRYAESDSRVQVIHNDHGGACRARNAGIQSAQYQWIAMLDADDVALPERLEKQITAAEKQPEVVLWGAYLRQINGDGKIIGTVRSGPTTIEEFESIDRAQQLLIVTNSTALFKKDTFLNAGCYDERLPAAQDTELWDRMANLGPVIVIPEPLILYRLHGQSITAKKYFDQTMYHRYINARNQAQKEGKTLAMEAFVADYQHKPLRHRFFRHLKLTGRYHYRNSGVYLAEKQRFRAAISLLFAMIYNPRFTTVRIWNRFFPKRFV